MDYSMFLNNTDNLKDNILSKSREISDFIFSNFCLFSNIHNESFDITSLEFYLFKKGVFEDSATHGGVNQIKNHPQLSKGKFYIHFPKNIINIDNKNHTFKIPQRFGIDITCGSNENNIYGGILIKGIDNKDGSKSLLQVIRGKKSYNIKIKRENKNTTWLECEKEKLEKINMSNIFDSNNLIYLKEKNTIISKLYSTTRIRIQNTNFKDYELNFRVCNRKCATNGI